MSENRKCFTFIWKIKNFSLPWKSKNKFSPTFFVPAMFETKWKLNLYSNSAKYTDCVACYFCRDSEDHGPIEFEIDYELSFLAGDGSVLHSETFLNKVFKKDSCGNTALHVRRGELLLHNTDLFIPDDILTVRCRMWNSKESLSESGRCIAETRIETECRYFVGTIEKFSSLGTSSKTLICFKSSPKETFLSCMNLEVTSDCKLSIEIKPVNFVHFYSCEIFFRDVFGKTWKTGQGEFHDANCKSIPLTLSKDYLLENRRYYLPADVLTIECEIIFPTGEEKNKVYEPEYGFEKNDTQETISNVAKTNFSCEGYNPESLTTLKDDFISMFKEGVLCDTKLKTDTETFPAHTFVLSARSSVFKSMFTTDMKEKTNNCVDIYDLDTDTVRRMLLFMYSDTLDDLEYESTKNLYFAADKYNIVSLKRRCSNILKQNLLLSNCCDILLLANTHQDTGLRIVVQDYITENDEVVLFSDEWKNLEKNHSQLTTEVLRGIYMKVRNIQGH